MESGIMGMFEQWMAGRRHSPRKAMRGSVRLQLGEFTLASMEDLSRQRGVTVDTVMREATLYYLADRESRQSWRYPRFAKGRPGARLEVTVKLEEDLVRAASAEADLQEVPLERLLEHAVLYYLADLARGPDGGKDD
jgi:hypothetical protein